MLERHRDGDIPPEVRPVATWICSACGAKHEEGTFDCGGCGGGGSVGPEARPVPTVEIDASLRAMVAAVTDPEEPIDDDLRTERPVLTPAEQAEIIASAPGQIGPPPGLWDTGVAVERQRASAPDACEHGTLLSWPCAMCDGEMDVTTGEPGPHTAAARAAVDVELAALDDAPSPAPPWNWCPGCEQDVQDDMRTGSWFDGSEGTCIGCGTVYVAVAYEDGSWQLEARDDAPGSVDPADLPPDSDETVSCAHAGVTLLCVAVLVTDATGRVALIESAKEGRGWEIPGGKAKVGEEPIDAAIREVAEEIGVQLRREDVEPAGVILGKPKPGARFASVIHVFRARAEGELRAGSDAKSATWWTAEGVRHIAQFGKLSDLASRDVLLTWALETVSK